MKRITLILFTLLITLPGCVSNRNRITLETIQQTTQAGSLQSLYDTLKAEAASGDNSKHHRSLLAAAGLRLGQFKAAEIATALEKSRLKNRLIPLESLAHLDQRTNKITALNPKVAGPLLKRLKTEYQNTRRFIALRQSTLKTIPLTEAKRRLTVAREVAQLAGPNSAEAKHYPALQKEVLDHQYRVGLDALDQQKFSKARQAFELIRSTDPNYPNLEIRFKQLAAGGFNLDFMAMLEAGNVNAAYRLLQAFSTAPGFEQFRQKSSATATLMANYFSSKAHSASRQHNYLVAYHYYQKALDVLTKFKAPLTSQKNKLSQFVGTLLSLRFQAEKRGNFGAALAYLRVAQELDPTYPKLTLALHSTTTRVEDAAIRGISVSPFVDNNTSKNIGSSVASRIARTIFNSIPNDVHLVERQQLASILQEQGLKQGQLPSSLAKVYFFIEGSIDEASVANSDKKGTLRKRVATRHKDEPNPVYRAWQRSGKRGTAPAATLKTPIFEDITLNLTDHRRVGLVSASYRIIDARTSKVIYTNTARETAEYKGQSVEGLSIGDYQQASVFADLPTALEITEKLANKVADTIADQLIDRLKNADQYYLAEAARLKIDGSIRGDITNLAYALVISERKHKDSAKILAELKQTAMARVSKNR